ncbi:Cell division protein BolA [Methylophaga frappieri]|uniref:Cell division protein BolA n=1 Tax=Methylophaga frappieri (strain ATCC BAA-2434 / DSM 25690 / JAM7) TaxID=754477 RepID=I1YKG0_METFJ|nr:BolA family protein [Methylophaga frappieri]AFJ03403.1 Cell division protein BolA [Methylophaga frappieri]
MSTEEKLKQRLMALSPDKLEIIDESHLHAGHAGNTGGGHFKILIVSEAFTGLLPLKRHRLVFDAVGDMMQSSIHALSIQAKTPAEWLN